LLGGKKKVTFADVAGIEEAKQELQEIVEFLKSPLKFERLGGKIPKGALLVGPPGTGKTLLAKANAGEAGVPFFTISGSDFVEMFVGVGASRVRDMFEQAKKASPCILFVDEIDAVGRHRGAGLGGGNDEREQTLNQLLVEMDGFETNSGIIVIAATNRPDVLDPALLRPGRFDRQIIVSNPDISGREAILKVHVKKVPLAPDVDLAVIARGTPGFSGADLANLINEAALLAARRNKTMVTMRDVEDAKDKVMMGSERRSLVMDDKEKMMTAYHEAGHAICSLHLPESDPLHKVTIIPRGRALGVTMQLPEKDKYSQSMTYLTSRLSILFGGRIAEEMILGKENVSTGASNDIQVATNIARKMVTEWGMSDTMGPIAYEEPEGQVFLGYSISKRKNMADSTALMVDQEIRRIIDEAYKKTEKLLKEHKKELDTLAHGLVEYETLSGDEITKLLAGKKIRQESKKKSTIKPRPTVPTAGETSELETVPEPIPEMA
jgi:cell division protease FtsH